MKRPVRVLKDLHITEVSSVDRGAGIGTTVVLMKQENVNMEDIVELAKRDPLSKSEKEWMTEIEKRAWAPDYKEKGETKPQAFTRFVCDPDTGGADLLRACTKAQRTASALAVAY